MATTVRDLIKGSLRLIQAVAVGETPSAEELSDGLIALNGMIGSWNTENLLVTALTRETFPLVNGKQSYTFGTGGDFNSSRPQSIEIAVLQLTSSQNYEMPMEIINDQEWSSIGVKSTSSSVPTKIFPEFTYPLATINVWPVPAGAANLVLTSAKPISEFVSANDTLTLAPGYFDALKYGLAMRLAPEYGKPIDMAIAGLAVEAKENIKRLNIRPVYAASDAPGATMHKRFSILTGD